MNHTQQPQQTIEIRLDEESIYQINTRIGKIRNEVYGAGKKGLMEQSLSTRLDSWMGEIVGFLQGKEQRTNKQSGQKEGDS